MIARFLCYLRHHHNPVRHPLGGFKCSDCGEAGADLGIRLAPRFVTNSGDTAIALALDSAGIARVLYYQVRDALREGRLVEVLAPFAPAPMPIHAVYPSARLLTAKVRAFIDLIAEAADWRLA